MRPAARLLACGVLVLADRVSAQPPQAPPAFRSGVDVVQLDVSVLDAGRRPVRGLTADDFVVLEDGQARPIVAFSSVELSKPAAAPPAAIAAISPDVLSNTLAEGRLVVILLDHSVPNGAPAVLARQIANAVVDALGPGDLAAVVHTHQGAPQNFTPDRRKLHDAIKSSALGSVAPGADADFERGQCQCGVCTLDALRTVAEAIGTDSGRRKTVFFIGERIPTHATPDSRCHAYVNPAAEKMFRALQMANVTVHALDPNALDSTSLSASVRVENTNQVALMERGHVAALLQRQNTLRDLAERTGGRAVLNTNAPQAQIPAILDETSSHYRLAFQTPPPGPGGRFRPIVVKATRRALEVRTRNGYVPRPARAPGPVTSLDEVTRALIMDEGLPMMVTAAPFAIPGKSEAALIVTVGVMKPPPLTGVAVPADESTETARTAEHAEILTTAIPADGKNSIWHRQALDVTLPMVAPGQLQFEALARLELKPGRYELRVAASQQTLGRAGSVHADVVVPDFANDVVSLSGVVLEGRRGLMATPPASALGTLIDAVPSTLRHFDRDAVVTPFVRVYQRRKDSPATVTLYWEVQDEGLRGRVTGGTTLAPSRFDGERAADVRFQLPIEALEAGAYVLVVRAVRGDSTARREVRFSLR